MPIILITLLVAAIAGVGFYVSRDTVTTPVAITETETTELITDNNTNSTAPETTTETTPANDAGATGETTSVNDAVAIGETTSATPPATPADVDIYKDGEYKATASYTDPGRKTHDIAVTLTLTDDVITTANVLYNGAEAKTPNHKRFEGAYRALVVGQSLENISLARVGGASLTTEAFNEAVAAIKVEAKS